MFLRLFVLCGLIFIFGCASMPAGGPPTTSPQTTVPIAHTGISHTVHKGETLWRISKMYHVDLEEIVRLNHIADSTSIAVGQTLAIPVSAVKIPETQTNFSSTSDADFIWPVKGKVITHFKQKKEGVASKGIDILNETGSDIFASRAGRVAFIGELAGYGPTIIIDHRDGFSSVYCGTAQIQPRLHDEIPQGAVIAKTDGSASRDKDGAFHFEIRKKHRPQNPLFYLD